jgi:hypothetical protein
MIWGTSRYGHEAGQSNLYSGDCSQVQKISTLLHILINVLSTLLLSGSNYTMQCLHSPTRAEIDRARTEKTWLDIGIPSWRTTHPACAAIKLINNAEKPLSAFWQQ